MAAAAMRTPETPESIRAQYASPRGESADERRKRLTNRRAAKYRYFRSLDILQGLRRDKDNTRQRDRRRQLDDATKCRVREQNRIRQQVRRQTLSDAAREEIREKHRMRQQIRRQRLDDQARDALREKERLRVRMRRAREMNANNDGQHSGAEQMTAPRPLPLPLSPLHQVRPVRNASNLLTGHHQLLNSIQLPPVMASTVSRSETELPNLQPHLRQIQQQHQQQQHQQQHAPSFSGLQFPLPSASSFQSATSSNGFPDRIPQLPHLQMALPQASSLLNPPPPPLLFHSGQLGSTSSTTSLTSGLSGPPPATGLASISSTTVLAAPLPSAQQLLPPLALPPPVRALPPLPDFLNSREAFDPSTTTTSAFFPSIGELSNDYQDGETALFRG